MLVSAQEITKVMGIKPIVEKQSFSIENKDKIAVVGVNGVGKSTLLKMIGKIENYDGKIIYQKDMKINYLAQHSDFDLSKTVFETISQLKDLECDEYEIKSILNNFKVVDINQKMSELSGGQLKRVALAITLIKKCDLLILDEPTNHLDASMIEYLEKYLIKVNHAIIMVTHDRYFLQRVVNRIFEIDNNQIFKYDANYALFLEKKAERELNELAVQAKRKAFLRKEIEWVRAGVQARGTKSVERLAKFEKLNDIADIGDKKNVELINTAKRMGNKTIELINVSKAFDEKVLFSNFSYMFKRYDRIGIIGDNGIGKSTLLNIIANELSASSGNVEYGETISIGYFKQGVEDMNPKTRVYDYIRESCNQLEVDGNVLDVKQMCEMFLFTSESEYKLISQLSGGEKRRLYLLKILINRPNVLILDEPTNDLDIQTLEVLENYLDDFNGIIITVSHDRYFLDRVCDGLFVIKDKKITYVNSIYSQYFINENTVIKPKVEAKEIKKTNQVKISYKDKKEFETIEDVIVKLETDLEKLDEKIGNAGNDFDIISKLSDERVKLEELIEAKNERFMELLELMEGN